MPKASEVAADLRKIADSLDQEPEVVIPGAFVSWDMHAKETFLSLARILPRPIKKTVDTSLSTPRLRIIYDTPTLEIWASIDQAKVCRIIRPAQPAVYDCEPILSPEEEAQLIEG